MRVLVTGGVRSGKSRHAEALLAQAGRVTYIAPGPTAEEDADPDWVARVVAHQARRPATWTTLETRDLSMALAVEGAVIVDCLGTWLTAVLDEERLWDRPMGEAAAAVRTRADDAVTLLRHRGDVVLVTNEVGLGVVPAHRSGRVFRDLLGAVNQQFAAVCDEVHLVVAGRVIVL